MTTSTKIVIRYLLCLIVIFTSNSYGQVFGNLIEQTVQPTVLIFVNNGYGSGILAQDTSNIFLITAKHVLYDSVNSNTLRSSYFKVQFYAHDFRTDSSNYIYFDLKQLRANNCLLSDTIHDICVLIFADLEKSGHINYYQGVKRSGHQVNYNPYVLDSSNVVSKANLYLGENVLISGFPRSLGLKNIPQFDYERPLIKRAAISSISNNLNNFIIDCQVYPGNSGGPVFLERTNFSSYKLRLVGIVTQYIPSLKLSIKNDLTPETSSYSVVVPIEYAQHLIYNRHN